MSYHIFIFGATLKEIKEKCPYVFFSEKKDNRILASCQKYILPMCNDNDEYEEFIGIEYGRCSGLFDNLQYTYGESLTLANCIVPDQIKTLFYKIYPNIKGKCYVFIQNSNTYTSHYANAVVMHGYWLSTLSEKIRSLQYISKKYQIAELDLRFHSGSNTEEKSEDIFIGKTLEHIGTGITSQECEHLATKLCETYRPLWVLPSRDLILTKLHELDPDATLSDIPMIALIYELTY